MAHYNLENYAPVEGRIAQFYADHPQGCIQTELAKMDGPMVVFWAKVYRNPEDVAADVFTSGWAMEVEGKSPVNRTSHLENCETSAVGRALANLNYPGSINGAKAPRPSREEMSKVQRGSDPRTTASTGSGGDEPWLRPMPFGKNKGKLLGDLDGNTLAATISWCTQKDPEKFAQLIEDCRATLEHAAT